MHKLLGNFQANSRCFPKILHSSEKFYRTTGPGGPDKSQVCRCGLVWPVTKLHIGCFCNQVVFDSMNVSSGRICILYRLYNFCDDTVDILNNRVRAAYQMCSQPSGDKPLICPHRGPTAPASLIYGGTWGTCVRVYWITALA